MSARDFRARTPKPGVPAWTLFALPAAALVSVLLAAQSARATREAAAADLQRVQKELEETRARVVALRRESAPARSGAAPGVVLAELAGTLPDDVRLETATLLWQRDLQVRLQVHAADPQAWDRFIRQLAASPRFVSVVPGDETREGAVRATVAAAWRP